MIPNMEPMSAEEFDRRLDEGEPAELRVRLRRPPALGEVTFRSGIGFAAGAPVEVWSDVNVETRHADALADA